MSASKTRRLAIKQKKKALRLKAKENAQGWEKQLAKAKYPLKDQTYRGGEKRRTRELRQDILDMPG